MVLRLLADLIGIVPARHAVMRHADEGCGGDGILPAARARPRQVRWIRYGGFPFHSADRATVLARVLTVGYFLFFLVMPWYTARDKTKPVPERDELI
jgi:hypothetical protein